MKKNLDNFYFYSFKKIQIKKILVKKNKIREYIIQSEINVNFKFILLIIFSKKNDQLN
jgi:hypothetical protein